MSENVFVTGRYSESIDLDPGENTFEFTSEGEDDIFIAKLDSNGDFVWGASVGGIRDDEGLSISVDPMGNVLTTGFFKRDFDFAVQVDFDPGPDEFNMSSEGVEDAFVLKLDNDGNFIWAGRMGGGSECIAQDVATDESGSVYITGNFVGGFNDFDPGDETLELDWQGANDAFLTKLDVDGNLVWATSLAGDFQERGFALDVAGGMVYSTGTFFGSTDFDPTEADFVLSSFEQEDIYVHKMNQITSNTFTPTRNDVLVYPNPTEGEVRIKGLEKIDNYAVYTLDGRILKEGTPLSVDASIDLSKLPFGLYLIYIESQGQRYRSKIMVSRIH
jgi:hypothetical protein